MNKLLRIRGNLRPIIILTFLLIAPGQYFNILYQISSKLSEDIHLVMVLFYFKSLMGTFSLDTASFTMKSSEKLHLWLIFLCTESWSFWPLGLCTVIFIFNISLGISDFSVAAWTSVCSCWQDTWCQIARDWQARP